MKIAMIGQKGIPSRSGGIEIHVEEISKRLAKRNCEVDVYCRRGYCSNIEEWHHNGINLKYAPYIHSKHLDAITHTFTSTVKALFSGCDIFHYHALGPATLSFIPRIFGKKVVCTVHGLDWQRGKWGGFASRYLKFGEFATAKFPNITINVSDNLVKYYYEKYGVDTVFIPNGVEKHDRVEPERIGPSYGLEKDGYILFLARLVPEKGAHYLIAAYKKLNTDKKLVIAGGASHSTHYEKSLHLLADNNPNIIFTGFVSGTLLEELYSNAYLYVLPSDIEGLPISLLEAMSFGNCCLTSDIPENQAVVKGMGMTFRKGDVEDLYRGLERLLNNHATVYKMKENIQKYVCDNYNWEDITISTHEVYKGLISK